MFANGQSTPRPRSRAETARLNEHFQWIIARMSAAPPPRLGRTARRARARHIEALERYRRRAFFPRNLRFHGRLVPHFIDAFGTRCAVAHLMEGEAPDLVHHIAAARNHAKVAQLVDLPDLARWLERNGLTAQEAALIQPSYETSPAHACVCTTPNPTLLEGTVSNDASSLTVATTYGPATSVGPGDEVQLYAGGFDLLDGDLVLARHGTQGAWLVAPLEDGVLQLEGKLCQLAEAHAYAPTDLPLEVFLEAAAADSFEACAAVLTGYASEWDPNGMMAPATTATTSGAGTGAGGGGEGGADGTPADAQVVGEGCGCSLAPAPALDLGLFALFAGAATLVARRGRR